MGGVHAACLDAHPVDAVAETGKHLATHLPAIQIGGGIGGGGAGERSADFVDESAGHTDTMVQGLSIGKVRVSFKHLRCQRRVMRHIVNNLQV